MTDLNTLYNEVCGDAEPKLVLHYFEEICKIPHGSYHTEQISDYLVKFAKDHDLDYIQDESGNVIIRKPGSQEAASEDPVILQGHMDMVLEKTDSCQLDLVKQHIRLKRDGDTLYAEGTTLGGDDGVAVAIMLAALDDDTLVHPPLECIFTVNEEVGMLGADTLDVTPLRGRRMINLDSEQEGIFTVGCAGGAEEHCTFSVERKPRYGKELTLKIYGLKGGHSGACIGEGRANAILILGRVLYRLYKKAPFRLISIGGGTKDNAIPRRAEASVMMDLDADSRFIDSYLSKIMKQICAEYALTDPDIHYQGDWTDASELAADVMTKKDTKKILRFLMLSPNGLIETDGADHSMPQTSLNLGILTTEAETGTVKAVYLVRSSLNSQKKYIQQKIEALTDLLDGEYEVQGAYPAWERVNHSPFAEKLAGIYEKVYGKKPVISVTHGGLECGLIAAKLKGLDCVSIGPDMEGIHTPDEKLSISSTKRIWDFLVAALREI